MATLAAFEDNFADLSGWTSSGLTALSNYVKASSAGTLGTAYKDNSTGTPSDLEWRATFELFIDKNDTADRFVWAGMTSNAAPASGQGMGAAYIAGKGICACIMFQGAITGTFGSAYFAAVPDARIATGQRIRVEMVYQWSGSLFSTTAGKVIIQCYSENGVFLGGGSVDGTISNGWAAQSRLYILSNTDKAIIGSFGWSRSYLSAGNFNYYPAFVRREIGAESIGDETYSAGMLLPRSTSGMDIALCFRGAGAFYAENLIYSDRVTSVAATNFDRLSTDVLQPWSSVAVALGDLYPTIAPAGGANTWGNDTELTQAMAWVDWLTAQVGGTPNIHLLGYSMGGIAALRFATSSTTAAYHSRIKSVTLLNACTGLVEAWKVKSFRYNDSSTDNIEEAYGITPGSISTETTPSAEEIASAHAALDAYDPLATSVSYANFPPTVIYYRTNDTTVDPTLHSDVLALRLAAAGVPYSRVTIDSVSRGSVTGHTTVFYQSEVAAIMDARKTLCNRIGGGTAHSVITA